MKKNPIRYEIIEDPYGKIPVLVGDKTLSTKGFQVQFSPPNESSWVGNFARGISDSKLDAVYELSSPIFLIIAGGTAYIVNTEKKEILNEFGYGYENHVRTEEGGLVLADFTRITMINLDGTFWNSERISFDGIKDLKIQGDVVAGLSYYPPDKKWIPFSYNLKTKELKDGSYKRNKGNEG